MATKRISGVDTVIDAMLEGPPAARSTPAPEPAADAAVPPKNQDETKPPSVPAKPSEETKMTAPRARRGRPLGSKSGEGPLRIKANLFISQEIMTEYDEWSWEERCTRGQLIEQAMFDYHRRKRRKSTDHQEHKIKNS